MTRFSTWPDTDPTVAIWDAVGRSDWQGALAWWQCFQATSPPTAHAYIGAALALRRLGRFADAEGLLQEASTLHPDNPQNWIDRGWLEMERQNWGTAVERWREARLFAPHEPSVAIGESHALLQLRRIDEADAVLTEATQRFPGNHDLLARWASIGSERRDWSQAAQRFQLVVAADPDNEFARSELVKALQQLGRHGDAEAVIEGALRDNPGSPDLFIRHAELATARADWPTATQRWQAAIQATDHDPRAVAGLTEALLAQQKHEAADALMAGYVTRFPEIPQFARTYALVAEQGGHRDEAVRRWRTALGRFPSDRWVNFGLVGALIKVGQFDEARALIEAALARDPTAREFREKQADLAAALGDWPQAISIRQGFVESRPDDEQMRRELALTKFRARLASLDLPAAGASALSGRTAEGNAATDSPSTKSTHHDLVMRFESLGDNCEFGLFQRHFAAEPLGLLRWAGTTPEPLIAAVKARFAGVGEPENTIVYTWPDGEYGVRDARYGMEMHTFTHDAAVARDAFSRQQMRRSRYLKDKLLQDIEAAEKLFVYKNADITEDQAHRLGEALREIGPATLLVVRLQNDHHPAGLVEPAGEGLLFGYIDHIPPHQRPGENLSISCWLTICERALHLRRGRA